MQTIALIAVREGVVQLGAVNKVLTLTGKYNISLILVD